MKTEKLHKTTGGIGGLNDGRTYRNGGSVMVIEQSKKKQKVVKKPEILKDKNGNTIGISIDATYRKNPKGIDEVFANIFSKYE